MNLTYKELAALNKMVISSVASGEAGTHDCIKEIHSKISEAIIKECEEREEMNFTYEELASLNKIIEISLRSGKIEFNEVSESVYKKVTEVLARETAKRILEQPKKLLEEIRGIEDIESMIDKFIDSREKTLSHLFETEE